MKWKCKKCGLMLHDQQNSFLIWNYDDGISIKYLFDDLFEDYLKIDKICNIKRKDYIKKLDDNCFEKVKNSFTKKELLFMLFLVLNISYNFKEEVGEIWRCPKCGNVQFEKEDWKNKGEIFDWDKVFKLFKNKKGWH
jgi:rubredoxin